MKQIIRINRNNNFEYIEGEISLVRNKWIYKNEVRYTLIGDNKLWNSVESLLKRTNNLTHIKKKWLEASKVYPRSKNSEPFENIKKPIYLYTY
jgi:hypothetical protein